MTMTLRGVDHLRWGAYPTVTPTPELQRTPSLTTYRSRQGSVVIKKTNLPISYEGVNYAWPQRVRVAYLSPPASFLDCSGVAYLGASYTYAEMHNLRVYVRPRLGIVSVSPGPTELDSGGVWRVAIKAESTSATLTRTAVVRARKKDSGGIPIFLWRVRSQSFTHLEDFTRIVVSAVKQSEHHRTSLVLKRKP